jgi:hypothetical protein
MEAKKVTLVPVELAMAMKELMERANLGAFPMMAVTNAPDAGDSPAATNSTVKTNDSGAAGQNPKNDKTATAAGTTNANPKP